MSLSPTELLPETHTDSFFYQRHHPYPRSRYPRNLHWLRDRPIQARVSTRPQHGRRRRSTGWAYRTRVSWWRPDPVPHLCDGQPHSHILHHDECAHIPQSLHDSIRLRRLHRLPDLHAAEDLKEGQLYVYRQFHIHRCGRGHHNGWCRSGETRSWQDRCDEAVEPLRSI